MALSLAPFIKVKIPGSDKDGCPGYFRTISTSRILNVDGSPSFEMLKNSVSILLQEKQTQSLVGLQCFDEEGDLVELITDTGLEEALTLCKTKLKVVCVLKRAVLELSLHGREHASVLIDYDSILKAGSSPRTRASASYWKLLKVATEAFGIPADYDPVMLFRVSIDGTKTEVCNDLDLSAHIERVEHTGWVEPVQIQIVGSHLAIAEEGCDMELIPMSKMLDKNCIISFSKLMKYVRRKNPQKPIKSFVYLDSNAAKRVISNGHDLVKAYADNRSNLTVHPNYQTSDLLLNPESAVVSGTCEMGNDPLRPVMLNAADSMAMWDVSDLVPGRYKAKACYFRSKAGGSVSLYTGKFDLPQSSSPAEVVVKDGAATTNCTAEYRQFMQPWRLEVTGESVTNADHYDWVALGEFEIFGKDEERFCIASQPQGSWFGSDASIAVRDISLIFVGL